MWASWNQTRGVKARSPKQVAAWLAAPTSDASQYKMWGNAVALPVVTHVLGRIKTIDEESQDSVENIVPGSLDKPPE